MQSIRDEITRRITESLQPEVLEVIDESELHRGHAGHNPEGESHFRLKVVAKNFTGQTRVERQRVVMGLLDDLLKSRIHALSMQLSAPSEAEK